MSIKLRRVINIVVIVSISLVLIFGFVKIVEAPFKLAINNWTASLQVTNKLADQNTSQGQVLMDQSPLVLSRNQPIEIIFGGDVMLSRQVNSRMLKYGDYTWPFTKIADFLRDADLTIVNLESPFVIANDYSVPTGSFSFKADPQAIAGLVVSGIDLVSLANNHTLNQGRAGLKETFTILTQAGIDYIGAGNNELEARRGITREINNTRLSFLAYAYPNDNSVATTNNAGIANMDIEKMRLDVERLKAEGSIVIVSMHAGIEYVTKPNQEQINFARSAIEAGAEAVIGHHPHWPQIYEFYQGKPIIYSLGNLVFDQMWSLETKQGLLAKFTWQDGWEKIELIPTKIYDYGQVEIIQDETERNSILKKIGSPESGVIFEQSAEN